MTELPYSLRFLSLKPSHLAIREVESMRFCLGNFFSSTQPRFLLTIMLCAAVIFEIS